MDETLVVCFGDRQLSFVVEDAIEHVATVISNVSTKLNREQGKSLVEALRASEMDALTSDFFKSAVSVWFPGAFLLFGGLQIIAFHQYWSSRNCTNKPRRLWGRYLW